MNKSNKNHLVKPNRASRKPSLEAQPAQELPTTLRNADVPKLMYSVTEASKVLNMGKKSVRDLVNRGLLKRMSGFRHIRIPGKSLNEFVDSTMN